MSSASRDLVLYTFYTPNCLKISILLEELGLPYRFESINMFQGEQLLPAFTQLNPNAKIPILRNLGDGMVLSESNAILQWLAEDAKQFVPSEAAGRRRCMELMFLQASSIGAIFGQRTFYMVMANPFEPGPARRFMQEAERLTDLTETLLGEQPYLLGADYSIVDIAFYPWFHFSQLLGFGFADRPHLADWYVRIGARAGVQRGLKIPFDTPPPLPRRPDFEARLEAVRPGRF